MGINLLTAYWHDLKSECFMTYLHQPSRQLFHHPEGTLLQVALNHLVHVDHHPLVVVRPTVELAGNLSPLSPVPCQPVGSHHPHRLENLTKRLGSLKEAAVVDKQTRLSGHEAAGEGHEVIEGENCANIARHSCCFSCNTFFAAGKATEGQIVLFEDAIAHGGVLVPSVVSHVQLVLVWEVLDQHRAGWS